MKLYFRTALLLLIAIVAIPVHSQSKNKFKIVLDAGHGGKGKGGDPGAVKNGINEKDINLAVVLKVGALLEKHKDIDVIYTRTTDVFLTLDQRPKIANKAQADIFVSIHCNSVNNPTPYGTETFVFGINNNKANLEVAKRENSVILLEDDYKTKYQGFNPNNPESIVGLMLLQNEYINQSINLASVIQKDFRTNLKRYDRGVKQASLWVLHQCAMPSVLIELGFISNKNEAEYLNSEKGQNELANSIANALLNYKKEYYSQSEGTNDNSPSNNSDNIIVNTDIKKTENTKTNENEKVTENTKSITDTTKAVFKIQIAASGSNIDTKPQNFKGLKNISKIKDGSLYKYYYGNTNDYQLAKELLIEAKDKGYTTSFITAFKNDKKISIDEALK